MSIVDLLVGGVVLWCFIVGLLFKSIVDFPKSIVDALVKSIVDLLVCGVVLWYPIIGLLFRSIVSFLHSYSRCDS